MIGRSVFMRGKRALMRGVAGAVVIMAGSSGAWAQEGAPVVDGAMKEGTAMGKKFDNLAPHPRLFVSAKQIERAVKGRGKDYEDVYRRVAEAAETGVCDAEDPMKAVGSFRLRGILMQGRLCSLAVQWYRTRDRRYLEAVLRNIESMRKWMGPESQIGLGQGQCIAAVAVAYDLLYNDMTEAERAKVIDFARTACVPAFLNHHIWWEKMVINWNPVCTSGVGMLALTMYEDLPDAQAVLDRVMACHEPIFAELQQTQGGWWEGLGYWNWTMHYLSLFGISYERATGEQHEGFRSGGFRSTLTFGPYFVPYGEACGFGDNQHGLISPSLLSAAENLGYTNDLAILQDYYRRTRGDASWKETPEEPTGSDEKAGNTFYDRPLGLLINPDPVGLPLAAVTNFVALYPKQGWCAVADRWPDPNVYVAARGGVVGDPGGHRQGDLLSWHALVGREKMIHNIHEAGYYPTAFRNRAREIYERNQTSKNTLFVGGISAMPGDNQAHESHFVLPCGPALRMEATQPFRYGGRTQPQLVCRLFVVLGERGVLVLDRVVAATSVPVEARAHTTKKATFGKADVLLEGEKETARMTFAADVPAVLRRATALLTDALAEPPTMMRWQTLGHDVKITLASLLTRGSDPVDLKVESTADAVKVLVSGKDWKQEIDLTSTLEEAAQESSYSASR